MYMVPSLNDVVHDERKLPLCKASENLRMLTFLIVNLEPVVRHWNCNDDRGFFSFTHCQYSPADREEQSQSFLQMVALDGKKAMLWMLLRIARLGQR